jgi:hypothetical protein
LHKLLKDLNAESATIIGALPNFKAVAAPILLPHKITLYPLFCKKIVTVSACCDYLYPRLIVSISLLSPHPIKSKDASAKRWGNNLMILIASILEDEFP